MIGDGLERRRRGVIDLIVGDQVERQVFGRRPGARQAHGLRLDGVVVLAAQQVLDRAVAGLHPRGQTQGARLAQRGVHKALDGAIIHVPRFDASGGVEPAEAGAVLHQVDRADQGAAAIQGRLRPLGHLDPLHVEQLDIGAARLRDRHPVLIDGHARLGRGGARVRGDAAHHKARIVRRLVLHQKAGHEGRQLVELLHAQAFEEGAAVGRQGEGHLDRILGAQLGGHDDVVHGGRRFGRRCRLGVGGPSRHQTRDGDARQKSPLETDRLHVPTP